MAVYGIDLGTTYSCIAYVDDVGRPTVLRNLEGVDTTPSVVYFESPENVVVGATAKDSAVIEPDLVISRIKRDMGVDITRTMHGRPYTPEEISALVLRKLAADARTATGDEVTKVIITVPAYFGAAERDATRKAGRIAGLEVLDVLSEPIAAAITYGLLNPGVDETILVYDLGGGTFDTTLIRLSGEQIEVVCTDGDHELGGADWDDRIVEHLADRFSAEHPEVSNPLEDKQTEQQLRKDAEELKRTLSTRTQHAVRVFHEGKTATVEVTRQTMDELTADLLGRTLDITRRTMETARDKGVDTFDHLVLVGGSTKMPAVTEALQRDFGVTPRLQDPDLAVAKGAALYAFEETYRRLLAEGERGEAEDMASRAGMTNERLAQIAKRTISTVASRAFGIVLVRGPDYEEEYVEHLVHANDALPASVTEDFFTIEDNQRSVLVQVMEQAGSRESESLSDNNRIADGSLKIPPGRSKGHPFEVTFTLDASGLLHVKARERDTGEEITFDIQIGGMSEEEVLSARTALAGVKVS